MRLPNALRLLIGGIGSVRLLLALDDEPLFGASLQIVELLAETRQVNEGMRISRLTRLQPVFRFGETGREAMCGQVQFHGARAILRERTDAPQAGDECLHLFRPADAIEPQPADRERAIDASAVTGVECERRGAHRMARRLERLNGDVAAGDRLA